MIVFESAAPSVRAGEFLLAGRRLAGRLYPYGAEAGAAAFRFDPVDRRFLFRRPDVTVPVGPSDLRPWSEALARVPPGPVLVGPCAASEDVRGAFRAAAQAALGQGRAVYLLDPEPSGLPEPAEPAAVVLCSWRAGRPEAAFPGLAAARAAGFRCAALFPYLPGWTGEPRAVEALVGACASGGAGALTALAPSTDGEGRRGIVEARSAVDPGEAERFFELVHHGDWAARLPGSIGQVREAASRRGLASLPPRPVGSREPGGNAAASARLEELAELPGTGDHRIALLHAAVRFIDESGRDLASVEREGNFGRIFPFGEELAREAASALRQKR
ncbi:MAG: hypothetical protein WEB59_02095 [Thermoanaerobaculia bacterium]